TPLAAGLGFKHEDIIRNADVQLGRILDELKNKKLLEKTMIVMTADHGVQSNTVLSEEERQNIKDRIRAAGKIKAARFDTGTRIWLGDHSKENRDKVLAALKTIPGVLQILEHNRSRGKFEIAYENFKAQPGSVK